MGAKAGRASIALTCLLAAIACDRPDSHPPAVNDASAAEARVPQTVTALGRIQPRDGITKVAGPSRGSVVIAKLLVDEGDRVKVGDPIAVLDTLAEDEARVARTKAELANAQTELGRTQELFRTGIAATTLRDAAQLKVDVAKAELLAAGATAELDTVRAPVSGQVIKIHARRGERVGTDGIAELA